MTYFRSLGQKSKNNLFIFLFKWEQENLLSKLSDLYNDTSSWIVFVHLLGEFKTSKRHFEIYWPLKSVKMPHNLHTKFETSGHSARPSWHSSKMTCMWSELAPPIRLSLEACLPIPFQLWEQGCFLVCCLWRKMPKVWVSQTLDCTVYRLDSKKLLFSF